MKEPNVKIDWTLAENDEAWQAAQNTTPTAPTPLHRRALARATFVAALLLIIIGGWLWQRPSAAKQPATRPSTTIVQTTAQEAQPLTHTIELLDKPAQIEKIQRLGNRAMAQLTVNYLEEGKAHAYRETHFYQLSDNIWQRSAPDPTLLGPAKTLKIAHFTILYRAVDADAIYQAAPKLEQLYANLHHDLGLPLADSTSSYTIEVATAGMQSLHNVNFLQRKLTVLSPTLLSAPIEIAPATLLYQAIVYPFARLAQTESIRQHDARWQDSFAHWYPIESALPLWEVWEEDGPLASGRAQLLTWLYANGQKGRSHQQAPNGYQLLCRTYHIWQITPSELLIPLTCTQLDQEVQPIRYPTLAPTWPQQTSPIHKDATFQPTPDAAPVTIATLIEYTVATYGRDKLPQLFDAMGHYPTAETLIPALFGVPAADFESGWQAYLAQNY